jgi:hypothetical protein
MDHPNRLRAPEWSGLASVIRESHRVDSRQALAYALLPTDAPAQRLAAPERWERVLRGSQSAGG